MFKTLYSLVVVLEGIGRSLVLVQEGNERRKVVDSRGIRRVNHSSQGSNQSMTSLSLPWAWHSLARACHWCQTNNLEGKSYQNGTVQNEHKMYT